MASLDPIQFPLSRSNANNAYPIVEQTLCWMFAVVLDTDRELAADIL